MPKRLLIDPATLDVYEVPAAALVVDAGRAVHVPAADFEAAVLAGDVRAEALHTMAAQRQTLRGSMGPPANAGLRGGLSEAALSLVRLRDDSHTWATRIEVLLVGTNRAELNHVYDSSVLSHRLTGDRFLFLWPPAEARRAYARLFPRRAWPALQERPPTPVYQPADGVALGPKDVPGCVDRVDAMQLAEAERVFVACVGTRRPPPAAGPRRAPRELVELPVPVELPVELLSRIVAHAVAAALVERAGLASLRTYHALRSLCRGSLALADNIVRGQLARLHDETRQLACRDCGRAPDRHGSGQRVACVGPRCFPNGTTAADDLVARGLAAPIPCSPALVSERAGALGVTCLEALRLPLERAPRQTRRELGGWLLTPRVFVAHPNVRGYFKTRLRNEGSRGHVHNAELAAAQSRTAARIVAEECL